MLNLYDDIIILRYNTLLNKEEYESIYNNTFDLSSENKKIYNYIYKKKVGDKITINFVV